MLKNIKPISISNLITKASHQRIETSRRVLFLNLIVYILIAGAELAIGTADHSTALIADGQNNLTGIVSVTALIVGLTFSKRPSDGFHLEGHWQFESLAVFLAGLGMFLVGLVCVWKGITQTFGFLAGHYTAPLKGQAAYMAAISGVTMLSLCAFNHFIARKTQSSSLAASARDFLSDALTSTGTMLAIIGASLFRIHWIDPVAALFLGFFIIWNGCQILSTSAEKLSNGFSPKLRTDIIDKILTVSGVMDVTFVDGRYSGNNIIIEAEITLANDDSLTKSYRVCKSIEQILQASFPVLYCCIQVKPAPKSASAQPQAIIWKPF
ncbi:cation diffusion facilitator family transporter [Lacticaseibacillus casei]|jgi:cation diffusion facilitator family transporter|uniref:Cation diffusion facilitator family transporter n=1 Tax=Lacticaseibacillus huelsenbergensis TaxID=3035291 RepID=A0ABY8DUW2_9LACO|nr:MULTISPECIES: cation diffusion facilitator family transporter [Lacticaseibacillus]MDG3061018.1 cation diffusion facilitator family transporter [Lacticaseibacillus sp. BCRC 81376]QVI37211.1 cation transporter [Lacticaseibacillus casei]QXG59003.1 cation diffusion facilitator family transporter [Lacticaseibacillus casei]WFB39552.1 cation diffusion facilitator family transporter [Lacticaseibacillus huelsenbergensis]WFB41252.1 cation diffusion facilitator family transporter [Lacticaseibacillus h